MTQFRRKSGTLIFGTIIFVIALHYIGILRPLERVLLTSITNVTGNSYQWGIQKNFEREVSYDALYQKYQEVVAIKDKLEAQGVQADLLTAENEQLRAELNFFTGKQYEHVGARIVGDGTAPEGNVIILDRGSDFGISFGDPVIIHEGVLIGKVSKVDAHRSFVELLNDNNSRIAATVINTDHSIGLVEGGFGISVHMNFIPQNENVHVGDLVITSGLEENIPRGLIIGEVQAVEKEIYQPFQRAIVSPRADMGTVLLVSVITDAHKDAPQETTQ